MEDGAMSLVTTLLSGYKDGDDCDPGGGGRGMEPGPGQWERNQEMQRNRPALNS
jgi:hypothetical protein